MFPVRRVCGGVIGLLVVVVWLLLSSPPPVNATGRTPESVCHVFKIGRKKFVVPFRLPSSLVQWHLTRHPLDHRPFTFYLDDDGDGFGVGTASKGCKVPEGFVDNDDDCDDTDPSISPGETEVCTDGQDNDCDGLTDQADPDCGPDCNTACLTAWVQCETPCFAASSACTGQCFDD